MRADYKEIRLSTFNDALKRMEAIKETSDISSKVSQVQNIILLWQLNSTIYAMNLWLFLI